MNDDIRFFPADPGHAKALTARQVQTFNECGYIAPLDALSPAEANASRVYFDALLERMRAMRDGRNAYAIMGYHNRCKGIWELAQHPTILDYVEDLIGPDIICWSSHYFCKVPEDPKRVPWHQDATYWPVRPTMTVTAWLAIDDVDEANAPMQFLPGSHRHGPIEWHRAEGEVALQQEIPAPERFGAPVSNTMRAGQISLHTSTLVHGSAPNRSSRRRCGLTFRYIPSSCGALPKAERVLRDGIVCRGDPRHWRVNPRPPADDLTPIHRAYMDQ